MEGFFNNLTGLVAIAGIGVTVTASAFVWIIRINSKQSKDKIDIIRQIAKIDKAVAVHSTEISNMKANQQGMERKMEDLNVTVATLNVTVQENGVAMKALKTEVDKYEKKLTTIDNKIDQIILNMNTLIATQPR